jgi:hypothetical protein
MGYWFGIGSTLPITRGHDADERDSGQTEPKDSSDSESSESSDDEAPPGEKLFEIQPSVMEECKLVRTA